MTLLTQWTFKIAAMLNPASDYRQIILPGHLHEFYRTKRVPANSVGDLAIGALHQSLGWVQGQFALFTVEHGGDHPEELLAWLLSTVYVITLEPDGILLRLASLPIGSFEVSISQTHPSQTQGIRGPESPILDHLDAPKLRMAEKVHRSPNISAKVSFFSTASLSAPATLAQSVRGTL